MMAKKRKSHRLINRVGAGRRLINKQGAGKVKTLAKTYAGMLGAAAIGTAWNLYKLKKALG